jgi:23S rRNA pseudouridine955/2504/2580 synthase
MSSRVQSVREVVVDSDRDGQRLDNFISRELGNVPRGLVYRLIRTGQVRINGSRAKPAHKLAVGDRVRVPPVRKDGAPPARLPKGRLRQVADAVIHRQDEFVVIDKPAGLASQRGSGLAFGLADLVAEIVPGAVPVHRLDRQTSGLMVFAIGTSAARSLQQEFRARRVEKRYLALLHGHLSDVRMVVDQPLKTVRDRIGQARSFVDPEGKQARSMFERLRRFSKYDYVGVQLETGRTHQIRAHAAWLGAPLAGDDRYNPESAIPGLDRLFLHAATLRLGWPSDQVFSSPLPEDLERVLNDLS